ncbi:hypothetical protein SAMN05444390_107120 [Marinobacterium lutimaris]|uniref:Uncharacterized protein n=2 Tax=Marinobacterium lutimaris TaxID=568106 RepID=A0A1H6DN40_9GAMM|nr:hypothetical protein SAMN05444390_107120 [Marinobacterium lutimaris]
MGVSRLALALATLVATAPVLAAGPDGAAMEQYLRSKHYMDRLFKLGIYWDRNVLQRQQQCQENYEVEPTTFMLLDPPQFEAGNPVPVHGIWQQRFRLSRCGETVTYNAIAVAKSGNVELQPQVPGESRAGPSLIKDLYEQAVAVESANMTEAKGDCKKVLVTDTWVSLPPAPRVLGGQTIDNVWEEEWTMDRCGTEFQMSFCFKPSAQQSGVDWAPRNCNSL